MSAWPRFSIVCARENPAEYEYTNGVRNMSLFFPQMAACPLPLRSHLQLRAGITVGLGPAGCVENRGNDVGHRYWFMLEALTSACMQGVRRRSRFRWELVNRHCRRACHWGSSCPDFPSLPGSVSNALLATYVKNHHNLDHMPSVPLCACHV